MPRISLQWDCKDDGLEYRREARPSISVKSDSSKRIRLQASEYSYGPRRDILRISSESPASISPFSRSVKRCRMA